MATKVLIISGGLTHERDVSVRSGRRVANILTQAGYDVVISDVDASLAGAIESFSPDVVWPLVHGSIGEDGSLQSFLESVGVPFVGSSAVQAMLASNKPTAKALLGSAGLATPGWVTLPQAISASWARRMCCRRWRVPCRSLLSLSRRMGVRRLVFRRRITRRSCVARWLMRSRMGSV